MFSGWKNEPGLEDFDLTFEVGGKQVATPQGKVRRDIDNISRTEAGKRKRFTAPLAPDGAAFHLRTKDGVETEYQGGIQGGVGVFRDFRPGQASNLPVDAYTRYVIDVPNHEGSMKGNHSDPFLIRANLYQEQFWQSAVDFLIDSRAVVATHPSAFGGCPWRDGTYYDAIIPSLVLFYLSDREKVDAMPRQIDWAAEKARVMDPAFRFDDKNPSPEGVGDRSPPQRAAKCFFSFQRGNSVMRKAGSTMARHGASAFPI